jgi:hypothetical protein
VAHELFYQHSNGLLEKSGKLAWAQMCVGCGQLGWTPDFND